MNYCQTAHGRTIIRSIFKHCKRKTENVFDDPDTVFHLTDSLCKFLADIEWLETEFSHFSKHKFVRCFYTFLMCFLAGNPPIVIARGGFSGMFPDSSDQAYMFAKETTSPDITLWCDLQLTKDGVGICFPSLILDSGSIVMDFPRNSKERFSVDFTWEKLSSDVRCE